MLHEFFFRQAATSRAMSGQATKGQAPSKVEELQGPATLMAFNMHFSTQFLVWMAGNSPGSEMPEVQVAVLHFLAAAALGY